MKNNFLITFFLLLIFTFTMFLCLEKFSRKKENIPPLASVPVPLVIPPSPLPSIENNQQQVQIQPQPKQELQNQTQEKKEDLQLESPVRPSRIYFEYHQEQDFWLGYRDGWHRYPPKLVCPSYNQGYVLGTQDRRIGRAYYYETYCPA